MIEVASAVECDLGDTLLLGTLSDGLANDGCSLDTGLAGALSCELLVVGSCCYKSYSLLIVHNLDVDLLIAPEDNHPGPFGRSVNLLADTVVDSLSPLYFIQCHSSFLLLLSGSGLTGLTAESLTDELDTLALIRLRNTE